MKYRLYVGTVDHPEKSFTAAVLLNNRTYQVHLKRFPHSTNFFILEFNQPCRLNHLQKIRFKNKEITITVIIPLIAQYNRRKLKKISNLFKESPEAESPRKMFLKLLSIEPLLDLVPLLEFLGITEAEARGILTALAAKKEVKIIELFQLRTVLYSNYLMTMEKFRKLLEEKFTAGQKTVALTELEKKLDISSRSLFFLYLFAKIQDSFSLRKTEKDLVFSQMVLSDDEKKTIQRTLKSIKKDLPLVFTLENVLQETGETFRKINDALWYLVMDAQEVVRLDQQYFILKEEYQKVTNKLKKYKRNQSELISIQAFRELTQLNRRTIIILFEAFDRKGITRRVKNDRRILLEV